MKKTILFFGLLVAAATSFGNGITGAGNLCRGASAAFTGTPAGGTWFSNNNAIAAVSPLGSVTGVAAGSATIYYVSGTDTFSRALTIDDIPSVQPISGLTYVCLGNTLALTDATPGGIWSAMPAMYSSAVASIDATGHMNTVAGGRMNVRYSVTNGCGTGYSESTIAIMTAPQPNLDDLYLYYDVQVGESLILNGGNYAPANEPYGTAVWTTWSSANTAIASVHGEVTSDVFPDWGTVTTDNGVVTGVSVGTTTITYTVENVCGSVVSAYHDVNVVPTLSFSGPTCNPNSDTICICNGATAELTATDLAGWFIYDGTSITTTTYTMDPLSTTVHITGVHPGVSMIECWNQSGSTFSRPVKVVPVSAGVVTGPATLCAGTTGNYMNSVGGGMWSTSNPAIAVVDANGTVTAISGGTVTISYSLSATCADGPAYKTITVNPLPDAGNISGASVGCVGGTIALTESVVGGVWSIGNAAIGNVNSAGVVSGIGAGSTVVTYTKVNACGTSFVTKNVTFESFSVPAVAAINGPVMVCLSSTAPLTDATPGGVWSSSNAAVAIVSPAGIVSGLSAGVATITYTVNNACSSNYAVKTIYGYPQPVSPVVSGPTDVCAGSSIQLNSTASGIWSRVGTAGTVTATGKVTGVSAGTVKIINTVSNSCGSREESITVTVHAALYAGTITGVSSVNQGSIIKLSNAVAGGIWSSSNVAKATVNMGYVTGVSAGADTIIYTVANAWCSASVKKGITVLPFGAKESDPSIIGGDEITGTAIVYPNPTSGALSIQWTTEKAGKADVVITDVNGKAVYQDSWEMANQSGRADIDLSALVTGVYFISVRSADIRYTNKIVIER